MPLRSMVQYCCWFPFRCHSWTCAPSDREPSFTSSTSGPALPFGVSTLTQVVIAPFPGCGASGRGRVGAGCSGRVEGS